MFASPVLLGYHSSTVIMCFFYVPEILCLVRAHHEETVIVWHLADLWRQQTVSGPSPSGSVWIELFEVASEG